MIQTYTAWISSNAPKHRSFTRLPGSLLPGGRVSFWRDTVRRVRAKNSRSGTESVRIIPKTLGRGGAELPGTWEREMTFDYTDCFVEYYNQAYDAVFCYVYETGTYEVLQFIMV
jgi:hypothetical protein